MNYVLNDDTVVCPTCVEIDPLEETTDNVVVGHTNLPCKYCGTVDPASEK